MKHLKNEAKTIDQNRLKIDQTSMKKSIKISTKNRPKINPNQPTIEQ